MSGQPTLRTVVTEHVDAFKAHRRRERLLRGFEHTVLDGRPVEFPISVFFTARRGLLTSVRVYREGSAHLPSPAPPLE
jgi:hypothetical protein